MVVILSELCRGLTMLSESLAVILIVLTVCTELVVLTELTFLTVLTELAVSVLSVAELEVLCNLSMLCNSVGLGMLNGFPCIGLPKTSTWLLH